ncbi:MULTISPECIES: cupin domain-containing protein [Actinoplanes]|uniref:cupin domain-containing protein n=1 Tax=Actinoplanes TaxID=1865 RepID=UPI001B800A7A|nr:MULTISPECIES: cupin domain-containing protein [Actinoplanes]
MTRLSVYDGVCAADGLAGGTPHLHLASTEAYAVIGGSGELHTLDTAGLRQSPLRAGDLIWFSPGVIHRAVNHGDLQVLVIMSNAGLPEAGDAVMTFPPDVVTDPDRYREAVALPVPERRELAVRGFRRLLSDPALLEEFYDHAVALVRPRVADWHTLWSETAEVDAARTASILTALGAGDGSHLRRSSLRSAPQSSEVRSGMCGHLRTHDVRNPG